MTDWSAGYVADIGYTYGYYNELDPLRANLAFLNARLALPEFATACELGFGQGMSANIHAAGSSTQWFGTDFNPSQAAFAQELATTSGAGACLYDDAFADFVQRRDLPDFDFIGLHGIWSWISDENRKVIVDFVRRKLKVGGVLYVSYNTLPGWAAFAPMRHLMTRHAEIIGVEGRGIVSRIDGALEFAEMLLETNPIYLRANSTVGERLKKLKEQNRHYLAHEYFNKDWHPMHFATMAEWLEPAKVTYACSAHYLDHIDTVNLTADQLKFVQEIPDIMLRQSVQDFMVNQQFRRDYWVKGPRRISIIEQAESLRAQKVILLTHRPDVLLKVYGALGEASLSEEVYNPLLDILADHKVRPLSQLQAELQNKNINFPQLVQAILVLASAGHLAAAQDDALHTRFKKQTDKLNTLLIHKSRGGAEILYLASPVTGGGISVGQFEQLFLFALKQGKKLPDEWAKEAWDLLSSQGRKILKQGKALETDEENLAELQTQAITFNEKRLPALKSLQIA